MFNTLTQSNNFNWSCIWFCESIWKYVIHWNLYIWRLNRLRSEWPTYSKTNSEPLKCPSILTQFDSTIAYYLNKHLDLEISGWMLLWYWVIFGATKDFIVLQCDHKSVTTKHTNKLCICLFWRTDVFHNACIEIDFNTQILIQTIEFIQNMGVCRLYQGGKSHLESPWQRVLDLVGWNVRHSVRSYGYGTPHLWARLVAMSLRFTVIPTWMEVLLPKSGLHDRWKTGKRINRCGCSSS